MFGAFSLKTKLIAAGIALLVIASTVLYIRYLHSQMQVMRGEIVVLKDVVEAKDKQIDTINNNITRMNQIQTDLNNTLSRIQNESTELRKKFEQDARGRARDMARIAEARPRLVENIINDATRDALRCNEIVTGSPLTSDEQSGKIKNTICPELLK